LGDSESQRDQSGPDTENKTTPRSPDNYTTFLTIASFDMADLKPEERIALIKENLAEFLNPEIIESIISEGRNPRIYWGNFLLA